MSTLAKRALVVDDEVQVQKLVATVLRQQGFHCDVAEDGDRAYELAAQTPFDVVITDLKMPKMNGHALVLKLLELDRRPLIVVHTGVIEPLLAKDLLLRGVDDILFKPLNFSVLAAKVTTLVDRSRIVHAPPRDAETAHLEDIPQTPIAASNCERISISGLNDRLAQVKHVLPMSNAAIDVHKMTRGAMCEIGEIAAAVQRDASLAANILRIANSSHYSPSGQAIGSLEPAILRVGQKRVGELALATSALSAMTPDALPWMDIETTWKRSLAAGIVLEQLIEIGGHGTIADGLMLSTIMNPLGRAVMGTLFPEHYAKLISRCQTDGDTLRDLERGTFPTSPTEVLAYLLETWKIPRDVHLPLTLSHDDWSALSRLPEPTRTRAELVKSAIILARLVVARWQSWELVQLPSEWQLQRLGVNDVASLLSQARHVLDQLAGCHPPGLTSKKTNDDTPHPMAIAYCNVSEGSDFLLINLLEAFGVRPTKISRESARDLQKPLIVNCLGVSAVHLKAVLNPVKGSVIVTDVENHESLKEIAQTLTLPCNAGQMRETLSRRLINPRANSKAKESHSMKLGTA